MDKKILILHRGFFGDTISALPSLWAIRNQYKESEIVLVSHVLAYKKVVKAGDLLNNAGIVDRIEYIKYYDSKFKTFLSMIHTIIKCGFGCDYGSKVQ